METIMDFEQSLNVWLNNKEEELGEEFLKTKSSREELILLSQLRLIDDLRAAIEEPGFRK
jgi:hypothetical protein